MTKTLYDPVVEERGVQKGIEQGAIKARKEDLLENLGDMGEVSESLLKTINEQNDIAILKKWVKLSAKVNSISEFESKINC